MHQQESISTLRLSTGWVWWLRIPEPSPIAMMIQAAQVWREEVVKPDSPHRETPIRQAIFWSLIQYLKLAIQNLGEEGLKEAKTSEMLIVVDTRRRALPQTELLPLIQSIQDHIHRETLSRFHATKKLEEGMEGETVRLFMDIAFRAPEANALFEKLSQLQGSAALQVAGIQFRPEYALVGHAFPGWARAHAQHDCAEFVAFVAARLCPQVFDGDWMARRSEEHRGVVALDTHTCEEAISVDLPPGDRLRAQFLIHEWHSQAAVHALRQPPRILILRFARYTDGPSGAAKNHAFVTWTRVLQMPMFTGDGMESANCAYSAEAAILHSGLSITTGHYTTLLIEADTILCCDDNTAPRRLTPGPEHPVSPRQDLPLARRHYMQSAAADPGGTHTPITIMACLMSLQYFLATSPQECLQAANSAVLQNSKVDPTHVLAASVLGDVRFHFLVVHVVAVIVLYALRGRQQRVLELLRQLDGELHGGLRPRHLAEVLTSLGFEPGAAERVVSLFREATGIPEDEPQERLHVAFIEWLCDIHDEAKGGSCGSESRTEAPDAAQEAEDDELPLPLDLNADLQTGAERQRQVSAGSEMTASVTASFGVGSEAESAFSMDKRPGHPKLYTRRPSMMNRPKPTLKGIGRRLSVEISERILEELDESTPWASSLKPDFMTDLKEEEEEPGSRTILIFDWDDTLLPTTACTADMRAEPTDEQRPAMEAHAKLVSDTLRDPGCVAWRQEGRVGLALPCLRLLRRPWLQVSAKRYMPSINWEKLFHELDIPIVYAREVLDKYRMMAASQDG
eukprot:s2592_g6.t1